MPVKVSVVIPVYNEKRWIRTLLARVQAVAIPKEIIVVDDFSTDGTRAILHELAAEFDLKVIYHERNRGKGAALRTGFAQATGDVILVQDADLEYDPQEYFRLIDPIRRGMADVVYGSRFLGRHRVFLFTHYAGNRFLTLVTNVLFNTTLSDMETGYKAFRADATAVIGTNPWASDGT